MEARFTEASNVAYTQHEHGGTVSVTYGEVIRKAARRQCQSESDQSVLRFWRCQVERLSVSILRILKASGFQLLLMHSFPSISRSRQRDSTAFQCSYPTAQAMS